MEQEYLKIIGYVNNSPWVDNTDVNDIINAAHKVFNEISYNKTQKRELYRLCGQTGSGKTTQLLFAVENYMKYLNLDPVVLGVRSCYKYHPRYSELLKEHGEDNIREATNGFSLKCMSYVLKLLIENGYLILLDITLLDPIYEEYVLTLLNDNNYSVEYHIMAVNKQISDAFIVKRYSETKRVVNDHSREYFNYIFEKGLNYICDHDTKNFCYIWNSFDKEYKYKGLVSECYNVFNVEKSKIKSFSYNEEDLRKAKLDILMNNN